MSVTGLGLTLARPPPAHPKLEVLAGSDPAVSMWHLPALRHLVHQQQNLQRRNPDKNKNNSPFNLFALDYCRDRPKSYKEAVLAAHNALDPAARQRYLRLSIYNKANKLKPQMSQDQIQPYSAIYWTYGAPDLASSRSKSANLPNGIVSIIWPCLENCLPVDPGTVASNTPGMARVRPTSSALDVRRHHVTPISVDNMGQRLCVVSSKVLVLCHGGQRHFAHSFTPLNYITAHVMGTARPRPRLSPSRAAKNPSQARPKPLLLWPYIKDLFFRRRRRPALHLFLPPTIAPTRASRAPPHLQPLLLLHTWTHRALLAASCTPARPRRPPLALQRRVEYRAWLMARLTHVTWHVQVHARSARAALLLSVRVRVCAAAYVRMGAAGAWGGPAGVGEAAATAAGGGDFPTNRPRPKPGLARAEPGRLLRAWLRIWQARARASRAQARALGPSRAVPITTGRPPKKIRKRGWQARNDDLRIFNTTSSPPAESLPSAPIAPPTESKAIITLRRQCHVLTTKLLDWFDAQCNDYNPYKAITSASIDQLWFGHPNDMPVDVRARPFILLWNETSGLSLQGRETAILQRTCRPL
ncbi:hypothetical protein JB92DRAFT_3102504 [Gautieria morchelliformis]|nr:hypothetical protein JB92DRAFT_3102504 [Gautieria morchelliformis]